MASAKPTIVLNSHQAREKAMHWVRIAKDNTIITFGKPRRTIDQNDKLHAVCTDIAEQVEWAGRKRDVEAWKDILTAALRSSMNDLDVVPGISGGFVLLGMHTSSLTVAECSDLIELAHAFGAEHGVRFTDPAAKAEEREREPA